MTDQDDLRFTVDQVAAASTALRIALGRPPEHFTAVQFCGMISDEIEQLRSAGWDDGQIAALVREATGEPLDASSVTRFYVGSDGRR